MSISDCLGCGQPCDRPGQTMHKNDKCFRRLSQLRSCQMCQGPPAIFFGFIFNYCTERPECARALLFHEIFPYNQRLKGDIKNLIEEKTKALKTIAELQKKNHDLESQLSVKSRRSRSPVKSRRSRSPVQETTVQITCQEPSVQITYQNSQNY